MLGLAEPTRCPVGRGCPAPGTPETYPAYLQIDATCAVTLFCDLDKGHHTTGHVDGDTLVLDDIAGASIERTITLAGDTLTVLQAGGGQNLPFVRSQPGFVVPQACTMPEP
jgi:hypothetical protein